MIRKPPLRRASEPMKRGGRIKPKPRSAGEFARIYGSRERVAFVKSLPCAALVLHQVCDGPIDNAHTQTGGMGRKANADTIAPMCRKHHREYDERRGILAFPWARFLIVGVAAETERLWQSNQPTEDARNG